MKLENDYVDWYYGGTLWSHDFLIPDAFDYSTESIEKLSLDFMEDFKAHMMIKSGYYKDNDDKWVKEPGSINMMIERIKESREKNNDSNGI